MDPHFGPSSNISVRHNNELAVSTLLDSRIPSISIHPNNSQRTTVMAAASTTVQPSPLPSLPRKQKLTPHSPHRSSTPRAPPSKWTTTSPPTCPSSTRTGPLMASRAGLSSSSPQTPNTASKHRSNGSPRLLATRHCSLIPWLLLWAMCPIFQTSLRC